MPRPKYKKNEKTAVEKIEDAFWKDENGYRGNENGYRYEKTGVTDL